MEKRDLNHSSFGKTLCMIVMMSVSVGIVAFAIPLVFFHFYNKSVLFASESLGFVTLNVVGDVQDVINGKLAQKTTVNSLSDAFFFGIGAGSSSPEDIGEAIVLCGRALMKSTLGGYRIIEGNQLKSPFFVGMEKKRKGGHLPMEQLAIYENMTLTQLHSLVFSRNKISDSNATFLIGGISKFSKLALQSLRLSPIFGENILEKKEKYFHPPSVTGDVYGVWVSVVFRGDNGDILPSFLDKVFYEETKGRMSHSHVAIVNSTLIQMTKLASIENIFNSIKNVQVLDVQHMLSSSILTESMVFSYKVSHINQLVTY